MRQGITIDQLGKERAKQKVKKPVELMRLLNVHAFHISQSKITVCDGESTGLYTVTNDDISWDIVTNCVLISKSEAEMPDVIMLQFDFDGGTNYIYLGKWNDGVYPEN